MNHLVVGALQESRIDRNHGTHTLRGHTRGKRDSMLLGDTHVIKPVGEGLLKGGSIPSLHTSQP